MNLSSRKAKTVSIVAFILSLLFFIFTIIYAMFTETLVMFLLGWQIFSGVLVWLILVIQFFQRTLAEQEKLDMGQLSQADQQGTIFGKGADRMSMLAVAQKRLAFFEKWIIPSWAILIAIYQITIGLLLYKRHILDSTRMATQWDDLGNPLLSAVLMAAISFVSFLFSRYATGMSEENKWKPLRAGGSYLLATAMLGFAGFVALALAQFKHMQGLTVLHYVIPGVMILLGIEALLNSILDIYRPRLADQYNRAAFDSRLLGLFNEPGGFLHTVAHTMDYQFGFKVSQTWFYQLLEKAILPLILFALLILYLMSSFVVIGPGQAGVVEYYGKAVRDLPPGLHMKWPWPIEKTYVYPTDQIQQIAIGYKAGEDEERKKALLWGEKHYEEEYNLLVAVQTDSEEEEGAIPVSIVQASVPILYRVSDVRDFIYNQKDSKEMLEAICYRELTRYAASAKIEAGGAGSTDQQQSLLGAGRMAAAKELQNRIQGAVNKADLGIEIVLVGLQGVHPPPEVTKEYEEVIASIQEKQAIVLEAQAEKNRILTELGGSIAQVNELYDLALKYESSKELGDTEQTAQLLKDLQAAFNQAEGKVFKTLRDAESYAFDRSYSAKGEGVRFQGQIQAYQASPEIYSKLQRLMMLEEALKNVRKYVVVADKEDTQVMIVDLQEKLESSLYDMGLGLDEE